MKNYVVALAAALFVASSSAAMADNFYVGAYAGPNFQQGHVNTTTVFSPVGYFAASSVPAIGVQGSQPFDAYGVGLGALAGYTWYFDPNWFAGLEVDFGINSDVGTATAGNIYPCCSPTSFVVSSKVTTNWLFTARPRVGYVWDNWAAYVTGGLAMTDQKARFLFTDTFATAHESAVFSNSDVSWVVGGGVEDRLSPDWTWRLEYLYAEFSDFGGTSANLTAFSPAIAFPTNVFTHHAVLNEHMVRFALTYNLE
ncbi:MAG TPA: outer membrane beta-barrel protein [Rhizomicrobium sp.]|nr:outer membrane beta-barrel protein [Rhizomicrobium sp.]